MKRLLLIVVLVSGVSLAQTPKHAFDYSGARLDEVLSDMENRFNIKYSFADSIVSPKKITLSGMYSLDRLHLEVERQTSLSVVKISDRYYSVHFKSDVLQTEPLDEVVVEGFLSKGIRKSNRKFTLSPQKIEELPGVTDADVLFSLQQLPGVKSPNETASGLHIRGGTPDQNLILWDGIRMYHPGHLFGMISGFNPNIDQSVHYYNKATSPKFGERISGTIAIETTNEVADSLTASVGANAISADAYLQIPLSKRVGLQLSARKSFTEWIQTPSFNSLADKVFQNTGFRYFDNANRFGFHDYSMKVNIVANQRDLFSATAIAIDNRLDFTTSEANATANIQKMDILNFGFSGRWQHQFIDSFTQQIQVYYSAYTFDYNRNRQYNLVDFEEFTKMNRVIDSGAEINYRFKAANFGLEFGYQLSGNDFSHRFANRTRELEVELDQKHSQNLTHSGYVFAKYRVSSWNFGAGARFSHFAALGQNSFEPRMLVQKEFGKVVLQVSYERKSQIVSQIRESVANDLSLENYVWILADGARYPIQKAGQFTSGMTYKSKSFLIDIDAYYKQITGITSLSFGFMHQYDSQIHHGEGFTKGIDVLIQKSAPDWRVWMTYTYQDSQNKYAGFNQGNHFPISSDITHSATISAHKKWDGFSVAAGWFWRTGKPYSILDENNQIVSFNGGRLPVYHRLDISAAYRFHQSKSWSAKTGFSILNLYGRSSVINKEYERQYLTIGDLFSSNYTVRDYHSLGFTPNVFIRFSF